MRLHRESSDNPPDWNQLPPIPVSPNTTPRKSAAARSTTPPANGQSSLQPDITPTKVPLKTADGPSPHAQRSLRRETDTDTLVSDRLSVMSFAFKGADQIRPVQRRVRAPTGPSPGNGSANKSGGIRDRGQAVHGGPGPKTMTPSAANAKFANRLRSPDDEHETDKDATIRPHSSKTRRSLPPAMALQPSINLPEQSLRNGTLLNPPRIVSTSGNRNAKTATAAPTPGAGRAISAATAKRLSMKAEQMGVRESTPDSPVPNGNDSTMALWAAYGAANGSESTPRRVVAGRQMGGRI